MSRVSLSELVGRIDAEDLEFGDPVAEIRLGLAAPRAELETGGAAEPDAAEEGGADTFEIEETLTLGVALAPAESERYWLHAEGSEFVAEVARWTIRELLEAAVEDFQAAETDETPEIGEVDDTDDFDETDDTRKDDGGGAASEARQDDAGRAGCR